MPAPYELRTPISVLAQVQGVSENMTAPTGRRMALAQDIRPAQPSAVNLADVTLIASEPHLQDTQQRRMQVQVTVQDSTTSGGFGALVLAAGNLIQNAVRCSPAGSVIPVPREMNAAQARLTVQDDGPGIP
jgi:signal transduction histidine kinase